MRCAILIVREERRKPYLSAAPWGVHATRSYSRKTVAVAIHHHRTTHQQRRLRARLPLLGAVVKGPLPPRALGAARYRSRAAHPERRGGSGGPHAAVGPRRAAGALAAGRRRSAHAGRLELRRLGGGALCGASSREGAAAAAAQPRLRTGEEVGVHRWDRRARGVAARRRSDLCNAVHRRALPGAEGGSARLTSSPRSSATNASDLGPPPSYAYRSPAAALQPRARPPPLSPHASPRPPAGALVLCGADPGRGGHARGEHGGRCAARPSRRGGAALAERGLCTRQPSGQARPPRRRPRAHGAAEPGADRAGGAGGVWRRGRLAARGRPAGAFLLGLVDDRKLEVDE